MKNKLLIVSSLVLGSLAAQPLLAQTAPATRPEVKADIPADRTKEAAPSLERTVPKSKQTPMASADNQPKSRDEVRSETSRANKAGELTDKGDTDTPAMADKKNATHKAGMGKHTKGDHSTTRADKMAEGASAAKNPDPTGGVYNPAKKTTP